MLDRTIIQFLLIIEHNRDVSAEGGDLLQYIQLNGSIGPVSPVMS